MSTKTKLKYYGWSAFSISSDKGPLYFDPFFRPYCGAEWYHLKDFADAKYICLTHGHEEHFLDVPVVAKETGATVIASAAACKFMQKRNGLPASQLAPVDPHAFDTLNVPGFEISVFPWKHRDVNVPAAVMKAIFKGNKTQLKGHAALDAKKFEPVDHGTDSVCITGSTYTRRRTRARWSPRSHVRGLS